MARTERKVIIVGAGAAGLSVGIGLAQRGYDVLVLERRSAVSLRQGKMRSLPERLCQFTGQHPWGREDAQESLRELIIFSRRLSEALLDLPAWYFVPNPSMDLMNCNEHPDNPCPLSPTFRRAHQLTAYRLRDRLIDPERLAQALAHRFVGVGGHIRFNAEVIGCRRFKNEIRRVVVRTPGGEQRISCDLFINAAGSRLAQVSKRIGSGDGVAGFVKLAATATMRIVWPFPIEPAILQFFGNSSAPVLNNLRVTPLGRPSTALVTSANWIPIDDPDQIAVDLQTIRRELLCSIAAGFELLDVPEPIEMRWEIRNTAAGHDSPVVLSGTMFGGSKNEFHLVPVNLRSVLTLRNVAVAAVTESHESSRAVAA